MDIDNKKTTIIWACPNCGAENNEHRCIICGSPRPVKQHTNPQVQNRGSLYYQGEYSQKSTETQENGKRPKVLLAMVFAIILVLSLFFTLVRAYRGIPNASISSANQTEGNISQDRNTSIPCTQLDLPTDKIELTSEGQKWLLQVLVQPKECTEELTYTSCDNSIAVVSDDGVITAIGTGSTEIVIRCGVKEILLPISVNTSGLNAPTGSPLQHSEKDMESSSWMDTSAAKKAIPNGSELTVRDIFDSFTNAAGSQDRMGIRYSNKNGSDFTGEILRKDIDHDGSIDILYRTAKEYEGIYEIRFGNGNILKISQTDQGATNWIEFFFEDLNGNGTEDILVQNVCSSTGGLVIGGINIYIDVNGRGKYQQVDLPQVALKMSKFDDNFVELVAPSMNYREIEVLGTYNQEEDYDYWYGWNADSTGYVTRTSVRDTLVMNGQIAVYYDFGGKLYSEISVQPVGVIITFSNVTKQLEINQIGSQWIKACWIDESMPTETTSSQPSVPPESELFSKVDYLQIKDGQNLFAILPEHFDFSSGAGGWATKLNINDDGSFDGYYHDSNMGETGEKYPGGTCYICDFSGSFSTPQKVSDYVYSVSISRLDYPKNTGTEWIEEGIRYVQAEPYGLNKTRDYYIYLPGCPYSVFTEEQMYNVPQKHEKLPQGQFCIYARNGSSSLGFWGTAGNCIFSNQYEYHHGKYKSELWPDGLFGKSNLVFWPEEGASTISLNFDWNEDDQREFVAEDERGSGQYEISLYVAKNMQSVYVMVHSLQGISLESWGGTSDGRLVATYSRKEDENYSINQDNPEMFQLDKSAFEVGNSVYLGRFEQDNVFENGKEPIEWRVLALDKSGEKALIISKYALTARCYQNGDAYPTWANSDIRRWLNGQFLRNAFTEKEQSVILCSMLSSPDYEGIEGGLDTSDRVFLLSREEAAKYFTGSADRLVKPTEYARAMGVGIANENGCCWWWLRTPGTFSYDAGLVYAVGGIDHTGGNVKNSTIAVRPALWINLSS